MSTKYIEVGLGGIGNSYTLEEIQEKCVDEENAIKDYLLNIKETIKYLKAIGLNPENLNIRTYFTVFCDEMDEGSIIQGTADEDVKPLDDLIKVEYMVTEEIFETDEQKDIYYNYVQPTLDKCHFVSYKKYFPLIKDFLGEETPIPSMDQIGKSAIHDSISYYDTTINIPQLDNQKTL